MGRKRTSNKTDFTLSIDKDLVKKLKELKINSSVLFTESALKLLQECEQKEKEQL